MHPLCPFQVELEEETIFISKEILPFFPVDIFHMLNYASEQFSSQKSYIGRLT